MKFTTRGLIAALLFTLPVPALATSADLTWFEGPFTNAVGQARQHDQLVLVYFWSDRSESCGTMYTETILNEKAAGPLGRHVLFSANYGTDAGARLFERFGVSVLPTVMVIGPDGQPEDAIVGLIDAGGLVSELERIERGEGTVSGLVAEVRGAKAGSAVALDASWRLAGKYADLGQIEQHDATLASIREQDPKAHTVPGARAHLWKVQADVRESCSAGEEHTCTDESGEAECAACDAFAKADLRPLYAFAKKVEPREVQFEAWRSIGDLEARREDFSAAIKAFRSAHACVPEEFAVAYPSAIAGWVVRMSGEHELDKKVRKFGLEMAETAVERAESGGPTAGDGMAKPNLARAEAMTWLARLHELNGDERKARKVAKAVLELDGGEAFREALGALIDES